MNTLVVFYSRSGDTRRLARRIALAMGAELEEIVDRDRRRGILGYLRSGNEAWFRRRAPIDRPSSDPAAFDLVVIGTPVWPEASACFARCRSCAAGLRLRRWRGPSASSLRRTSAPR